ncbi:YlmC/YmxH family sporulation protein [Gorillibacterium sp. sgz5001074]|uniref:YlmC/YmxH family sporulation protein n=1 Tax=Gorillibacterium sp. sgz5001074 TaxID=3446695 RepID=UPI003F6675BB
MKISDFQSKDVINIVDGKKLGQISDLELDLRQGRIESIVVPAGGRIFGFWGGGTDVVIPWRNIVKIGMDVVLVKLDDTRAYREENEGERDRDRVREREYARNDYRDR